MKRLWVLHLIANAVLLGLLWEWLGIRDARAWQLALTAVLGVVLLGAAVLLHAGTFHWMATQERRPPLRSLLNFSAALAIFLVLAWLLSLIPLDRASVWTGSYLTFHSRKPINPATVLRIFNAVRWFVQWVLAPILLLPVAACGFGRDSLRQSRKPRFWLEYIVVLVAGFYLPGKLIHWVPKLQATAAEVISFVVRFGIAYCLAVAGWLALAFFSSGGKPAVTQTSTAPLP